MKVAFFGLYDAFNYFRIGGGDSYLRRLNHALLDNDRDLEIAWVTYNAKDFSIVQPRDRLTLLNFPSLDEALKHLCAKGYAHVINVYALPKDRWKIARFRRQNPHIAFHILMWSYPDSAIKRFLKFSELLLQPYNGYVFCASPRLYNLAHKFSSNAVYLPPPVPDEYFLSPDQKDIGDPPRIAYIGRIDPRKGIDDAATLLSILNKRSIGKCAIYGFYIDSDPNAVKCRKRLLTMKEVPYIETPRNQYSGEEDKLRQLLHQLDVLILPYKTLDSTIDIPLLLVEAMAALVVVVTRPIGDIPRIYGESPFIIRDSDFIKGALNALDKDLVFQIIQERERIYDNTDRSCFHVERVVDRWLRYVTGKTRPHVFIRSKNGA